MRTNYVSEIGERIQGTLILFNYMPKVEPVDVIQNFVPSILMTMILKISIL